MLARPVAGRSLCEGRLPYTVRVWEQLDADFRTAATNGQSKVRTRLLPGGGRAELAR